METQNALKTLKIKCQFKSNYNILCEYYFDNTCRFTKRSIVYNFASCAISVLDLS